jgi:hypothetical protein
LVWLEVWYFVETFPAGARYPLCFYVVFGIVRSRTQTMEFVFVFVFFLFGLLQYVPVCFQFVRPRIWAKNCSAVAYRKKYWG